jgi:hypothetical protein
MMSTTNVLVALAAIAVAFGPCPADGASANCRPGHRKKNQCLAITGPNGGEGACKFVLNRNSPNYNKCINDKKFVDAAAPAAATPAPTSAAHAVDCSAGNYRKRRCQAFTGPNGGEGACKYKNNPDKASYKKCVPNKQFVDNAPEAKIACPGGAESYTPTPYQRQTDNTFRIDRGDAGGVDDCATLCSSLDECVFFTFRQSTRICDRFTETPPEISLTRNVNFDAYERLARCTPQR